MSTKKHVSFEAGGEAYKLSYTINAQCNFEDASGLNFSDVAQIFADALKGCVAVKVLRVLFWAGLTEFHDKITIKQAGEIMEREDVGVGEVLRLVSEAVQKAYPAPKGGEDQAASGDEGNGAAA